jgi:endonuclease YncB( thermonuclease family)
MLGLVAVIGLAVAAPALGQTVVDGDTNKLNGTTYRIWSIDAAERKLICAEGWWLGKRHRRRCSRCSPAASHLRTAGHGPAGRVVALCRADGQDVAAAMVSAGMAWLSPDTAPTM